VVAFVARSPLSAVSRASRARGLQRILSSFSLSQRHGRFTGDRHPIADTVLDLIGGTPLVRIGRLSLGSKATILAKLEAQNPMGSVKDRAARMMIRDAEAQGRLAPGGTVVEATSGNTGIGLALVCAVRDYRLILAMPETMSVERRRILSALGARVVLTPGRLGMTGAVDEAERLAATIPGAFQPKQFENPSNPRAHEETTGPEIWRDTGGRIDALVAGIGTGGTISGAGRYLKRRRPGIRIVGVEPAASPVLKGGPPGAHGIQGIGAGFAPSVLDRGLLDEVVDVEDAGAIATTRRLAREEGLFAGVSSGAAMWAALDVADRPEFAGKTIVVILPDTGERYVSSALWEEPDDLA
jgi:cysteine synthase